MKIFKHKYKFIVSMAALFFMSSCKLTNLDINTDPNNPSSADLSLLLPNIEKGTVDILDGVNQNAHGFMGLLSSADSFDLTNNSYNGTWNSFYYGPAKDLDEYIKAATKLGTVPVNLGIGQVLKAYYVGLFVDMFGDIPYSEAWNGNAATPNSNPKFDSAKDIYADLISLCDQAVANLAKTQGVAVSGDLFYSGSAAKWTTLANTVKLRLLINSRNASNNAAAIKTIIDGKNYISTASNDFVYKFNKVATPDGRHPWFQAAYTGTDNNFTYISHQLMFEMILNEDPRLPFYFKRQTSYILNQNDPSDRGTTPCSQIAGCRYGYMVLSKTVLKQLYTDKGLTPTAADLAYLAGYFGRDRGDNEGVPQDLFYRTVPGTYPAAGAYDVATASPTANTGGKYSGNGIFPLITSWMTKYYQIEAILTGNLTGDARALFESAMREQITKVTNLGIASDPNAVAPTAAAITKYVNLYLSKYDAATTDAAKLNVALKQAWFSNWGNGFEIWNAFRRTGFPGDIAPPIIHTRQFALRLPYPTQELSLNKNAPATPATFDADAIFWDTLKYKFPN